MNTNKVYNKSSENMEEVEDNSISLIVTSPPYNLGVEYDVYQDSKPFDEYLSFLETIMKECYRVLKKGGRICLNIGNGFGHPYVPTMSYVNIMMLRIGFLMRSEVIWFKEIGQNSGTTAWGSWCSPHNCSIRLSHEYISIFSKEDFVLEPRIEGTKGDITSTEFPLFTRSEWKTRTSTHNEDHPATFPEEIPYRCIKLYSYPNDIILDPFCGLGNTLVVAKKTGRNYIGYDISSKYCKITTEKLKQEYLSIK